jgi:hypothetical protein
MLFSYVLQIMQLRLTPAESRLQILCCLTLFKLVFAFFFSNNLFSEQIFPKFSQVATSLFYTCARYQILKTKTFLGYVELVEFRCIAAVLSLSKLSNFAT